MIFLEGLIYIVLFYLFGCLAMYINAVVKTLDILGFWVFSIENSVVGICKCPKFMMFWMEWIYKKIVSYKNKRRS